MSVSRQDSRRVSAAMVALIAVISVGGSAAWSGADGMGLDEVIARHTEARGGSGSWARIESLKLTGTMRWLSEDLPFALWKKSGGKYLLELAQHGGKVLTGSDGRTGWRGSPGPPVLAQALSGLDLAMLITDSDIGTPFMQAPLRGLDVKLIGSAEFEGREAIGLDVVRADGLRETWYLDPSTFLEMGRISPGSDFGREVVMRTWYDDFREVGGVKVPFRIESQWHVLERTLVIQSVEVNAPIDDARFVMPRPEGMAPLMSLAGEWQVVASQSAHPGAPWRDAERTSTIEKLLGGVLLQERFTSSSGQQVVRSFTHDRFRQRYRITEISEASAYLDVEEGTFDDRGRLVLSNVQTGTSIESGGHTVHVRMIISELGPDSFRIDREISTDGGTEWFLAAKAAYTRRKDLPASIDGKR